jgi:MFS family permease
VTTIASERPASDVAHLRRRTVALLAAGVALGSTGHIAAGTVATIVAEELSGTSALSGVPPATVVLGAAIGSSVLSALMARRGRRFGLSVGYGLSVLGAVIAGGAVILGSLPVLLGGTLLIGFGNTSNQLARYAAADLYPPERRGSAIGLVVWGATVGAIIGPNLIWIGSDLALRVGLPELAGPYLIPVVFVGLACIVSWQLLRPDPSNLVDESTLPHLGAGSRASVRELIRRPAVAAAAISLLVGMVVMVLIMTMTPLHMTSHGHGLTAVGFVISAHTFGMFALSPISGRLTDRLGTLPVIFLGSAVLAIAATLSAVAEPEGGEVLALALFLLGWGWNLGFVAGSELLTADLAGSDRTRVQGLVDTLIWSSAAIASLGSGIAVAAAGFASLGVMSALLVGALAWYLVVQRDRLGRAADPLPSQEAAGPP